MISVNGEPAQLPDGVTVAELLARMGIDPASGRGVAVAVDGEVVPRGHWTAVVLAPSARVEVLTAMQGG